MTRKNCHTDPGRTIPADVPVCRISALMTSDNDFRRCESSCDACAYPRTCGKTGIVPHGASEAPERFSAAPYLLPSSRLRRRWIRGMLNLGGCESSGRRPAEERDRDRRRQGRLCFRERYAAAVLRQTAAYPYPRERQEPPDPRDPALPVRGREGGGLRPRAAPGALSRFRPLLASSSARPSASAAASARYRPAW